MRSRFMPLAFGLLAAAAMPAGTGGCDRPGLPTPSTSPAIPVALATPEQAVRSLLHALQALLDAKAARRTAEADQATNTIIERLMDREEIIARLGRVSAHTATNERKALRTLAENWAAILSYYAAGLELENPIVVRSADGSAATVDIAAQGPEDRAVLRILCRLARSGAWQISSLEFAPPATTATRPVTSPAATATAAATAPHGD